MSFVYSMLKFWMQISRLKNSFYWHIQTVNLWIFRVQTLIKVQLYSSQMAYQELHCKTIVMAITTRITVWMLLGLWVFLVSLSKYCKITNIDTYLICIINQIYYHHHCRCSFMLAHFSSKKIEKKYQAQLLLSNFIPQKNIKLNLFTRQRMYLQ